MYRYTYLSLSAKIKKAQKEVYNIARPIIGAGHKGKLDSSTNLETNILAKKLNCTESLMK